MTNTSTLYSSFVFATGAQPDEEAGNEAGEEVPTATETTGEGDEHPTQTDTEEKQEDDNFNPQDGVDDIAEGINTMTIHRPAPTSNSGPFSLSASFPYLMYNYVAGRFHKVTIDFIVIGMAQKYYRPLVSPGGKTLQLGMVIPKCFAEQDRVQIANETATDAFNEATHKATAFETAAAGITDPLSSDDPILSNPQSVSLPFAVEEEIESWELQIFDNEDDEFAMLCSGQTGLDDDAGYDYQKFFILSVTLVGKKVRKNNPGGGIRAFGSPNRRRRAAAPRNETMVQDDE